MALLSVGVEFGVHSCLQSLGESLPLTLLLWRLRKLEVRKVGVCLAAVGLVCLHFCAGFDVSFQVEGEAGGVHFDLTANLVCYRVNVVERVKRELLEQDSREVLRTVVRTRYIPLEGVGQARASHGQLHIHFDQHKVLLGRCRILGGDRGVSETRAYKVIRVKSKRYYRKGRLATGI